MRDIQKMKNTLMMNIQWEDVKCYICHSKTPPEPILLRGKPLVDGQFGYSVHPVICKGCGFVYLSPRWNKRDYDKFYANYYDELYRLEIKPDYGIAGVLFNMKEIWGRIKDKIETDKVKNILDTGCGFGYGLKYLREQIPGSRIYGIESSSNCCKVLQSKKIDATLITTDFDSDWTKDYKGKMDLIILRHTVEHMLEPVKTLKKLSSVLSKNGVIYIAVPDMMRPRLKLKDYDKWWEYCFRPVHVYYFSMETLFKTLDLAGLEVIEFGGENEEIWYLAKDKIKQINAYNFTSVYKKQMQVLRKYLYDI